MSARHVSTITAGIFGRGDLPPVVECVQAVGSVPAGAVLRWSDTARAYRLGAGYVLAGFVRARFLGFFRAAADWRVSA